MRRFGFSFCAAVGVCASAYAADLQTQAVQVIGITPTLGTGIDKDKVPANIQNFNADEMVVGQAQQIQ